jgi:hypothetical protein
MINSTAHRNWKSYNNNEKLREIKTMEEFVTCSGELLRFRVLLSVLVMCKNRCGLACDLL